MTRDACDDARCKELGGRAAMHLCLGVALMAAHWSGAHAQDAGPRTRAEQSAFQETSTLADVIAFVASLQRAGASLQVTSLGTSTAGHEIPLVIAAHPPVTSPAQAHQSGRVIVYVQGNIHGGEVEGKEAALTLLREVTIGSARALLDRIVLVVAPIYNVDGNEAWGPGEKHRPGQLGPARVGLRTNGMGLDLNRDCMKVESPEMRGALQHVYVPWDPHVVIDLHTTNGTRHGYLLTYSPPLHPATEAGVLAYARDALLPAVRARLREEGLETFDYGNLDASTDPATWSTFGPEGRYVTNYAGLRGRLGILSEATSYRTFEERVRATERFVGVVLAHVAREAAQVVEMTRAADRRVVEWGLAPEQAPAIALRCELEARGTEPVLIEKPRDDRNEKAGHDAESEPMPSPLGELEQRALLVRDRFSATRTTSFPRCYLLPASLPEVVALLVRHGIVVEEVLEAGQEEIAVHAFRIEELHTDTTAFQGHHLQRLEGSYRPEQRIIPAGSFLVRTAQPLGLLITQLLEPESLDGVAAWGFLDRTLGAHRDYPITKTVAPVTLSTRQRR